MNICIIAQVEPSLHKGGGKAQYFLAQEWRRQGHVVKLVGADQLIQDFKLAGTKTHRQPEKEATRLFIEKQGAQYDIIDVDHGLLSEHPINLPSTLVVGRSVLFKANRLRTPPPEKPKFKTRLKRFIQRWLQPRAATTEEALQHLGTCLSQADLLNVTSKLDIESAMRLGIPAASICIFPYALDPLTIDQLAHTQAPAPADPPQLVFLGTFDYRKGCLDLVQCFRKLRLQFPTLELSLIGAKGLHPTEKEVRSFFNADENQHLHVHMTFPPDSIDALLARKHAAIFPSYYEGFPFSVQETLAAGIPTIAYNTPGAHDLLPPEWLVDAGNVEGMCEQISALITKADSTVREQAKSLIQQYNWQQISTETLTCYETHLTQKRAQHPNH